MEDGLSEVELEPDKLALLLSALADVVALLDVALLLDTDEEELESASPAGALGVAETDRTLVLLMLSFYHAPSALGQANMKDENARVVFLSRVLELCRGKNCGRAVS